MSFSRWKTILIPLVAGFALGAVFTRLCLDGRRRPPWKMEGDLQGMLGHFSRKLDLNEEQRRKVSSVLEAQKPKMEALRAECRPKMEALRGETDAGIREILDEGQRLKFDAMQKKWKERAESRRGPK